MGMGDLVLVLVLVRTFAYTTATSHLPFLPLAVVVDKLNGSVNVSLASSSTVRDFPMPVPCTRGIVLPYGFEPKWVWAFRTVSWSSVGVSPM